MPAFNLALLEVQLAPLAGILPVATAPIPTPAGQPTAWEFRSVGHQGEVFATYLNGKLVAPIVETVNGVETTEFELPLDADVAALRIQNRGVQIYRNGHLLLWGPPTTLRADSANRKWRFGVRGPLWYFGRRFVGKANRTDLLDGVGNFEGTDLATYWTVNGSNITVTADTTIKLLDNKSAKIVTTSHSSSRYINRSFVLDGGSIGTAVFLVAWVYIESMTTAPPFNLGAVLQISSTSGVVRTTSAAQIDTGTPVNGWRRLACVAHVLPNRTEIVDVQLWAPVVGTVYYDAVRTVVMESLAFIGGNHAAPGWDQVEIAHIAVDHFQGVGISSVTFGEHNGKSNLHIGTGGALSGIIKERVWQHYDHARGFAGGGGAGVLDEFTKASDGFDHRIDATPLTRTYTTYYPNLGTVWAAPTFRYVRDVTNDGEMTLDRLGIVHWSLGETIEETANQVVVLGGWGQGAGREEGAYNNPATMDGLTLERVEAAPNDTPIDKLDAVAEVRGEQLDEPVETIELVLEEPRDPITQEVTIPLIGVLRAGDVIPVLIIDGLLTIDGYRRVARVAINPDDTLTVTCNRYDEA